MSKPVRLEKKMTVFVDTFDKATPLGTDAPSVLDNRDRETKAAVQERSNVDHYWPLTGTQVSDADTGEHRKVTLRQTTKPTAVASKAFLYSKDIGDQAEFFIMSEDGVEIQVSRDGKLNLDLNRIANNTAITADNQAGDGTIDLIKATRNVANDADVVQLPDKVRVATSAAPTEDTELANMKFVNDQIAAKTQSAQAVGTSNISETTGSFADMANMTITITTTGGDVLLMFGAMCLLDASGTAHADFRFDIDGTPQGGVGQGDTGSGSGQHAINMQWLETSLSAGSHTFKVQWKKSLSLAQNGATFPRVFTAVELP